MKVEQLFERTPQSRSPQEIEATIKRLAFKHLLANEYGKKVYSQSDARHAMDFEEWKEAKYDRDFDVKVKANDPQRISVDIDGILDLGERLGVVSKNDPREERISDAKKWLNKTFNPMGWFLFRVGSSNFQLDPISQAAISVPNKVYHFTPVWNKDSILRKGLIPKRGGYDDDYIYPPRVHVLTKYNERVMYDLAMNIFNWGNTNHDGYHGDIDVPPLAIFEIDTSKLNRGTKFHHDISVKNGAWTYTHIPASALKLIHEDEFEED